MLLFHQTPRSWEEYLDVLPILGRQCRAIAVDAPGFGESDAVGDTSIEVWAEAAFALLDALGIDSIDVVGHHTGAVIGFEMAARSARISRLVLSACPFVDEERRLKPVAGRVIDEAVPSLHGDHLSELWWQSRPYYPDDVGVMNKLIVDIFRAGPWASEGHRIVNGYKMESRASAVKCPTLVVVQKGDPTTGSAPAQLTKIIERCSVQEVEGAMVPFPDQLPATFAGVVARFLAAV